MTMDNDVADPPGDEILTEEEFTSVTAAVINGQPSQSASESQIQAAIKWARETRISQTLLDGMIVGDFIITSIEDDGEPIFGVTEEEWSE